MTTTFRLLADPLAAPGHEPPKSPYISTIKVETLNTYFQVFGGHFTQVIPFGTTTTQLSFVYRNDKTRRRLQELALADPWAPPPHGRISRTGGSPAAREDLPHGRISRAGGSRAGGSPSCTHMHICHENPPFKKTFKYQKISARFCPPRSGRPRTPHTPTLLC